MTTSTLTLTEFLLARIAEDEAPAKALADEQPDMRRILGEDNSGPTRDEEYAALNIGVDRVLAECEAKRQRIAHYERIAAMADPVQHPLQEYVLAKGAVERQLRFDAAIHRDHPDYCDEWRP